MKLSVRQSLKYPLLYKETKINSLIILILSIVPFGSSFLMSPYATVAVSVIPIERDESVGLSGSEIFSRFIIAFLGTLICFLYAIPGFIGFGLVAYFFWTSGKITDPALLTVGYLLLIYGALVLSILPLATLHAVTMRNPFSVLSLPKLFWIGLKIDFKTFLKMLAVGLIVFCFKIFVSILSLFGIGFLMVPFTAYSEYVYQYMLAVSYASVIQPRAT